MKKKKSKNEHCFNESLTANYCLMIKIQQGLFNPLNPTVRYSGLCKGGAKNRHLLWCVKTRRECKPAHVRSIINCFVYTGRYQATLRSQVESSSLFSFGIHAIYYEVFVLDVRFCIENMAEIFSVCEYTHTRLMLWTM